MSWPAIILWVLQKLANIMNWPLNDRPSKSFSVCGAMLGTGSLRSIYHPNLFGSYWMEVHPEL